MNTPETTIKPNEVRAIAAVLKAKGLPVAVFNGRLVIEGQGRYRGSREACAAAYVADLLRGDAKLRRLANLKNSGAEAAGQNGACTEIAGRMFGVSRRYVQLAINLLAVSERAFHSAMAGEIALTQAMSRAMADQDKAKLATKASPAAVRLAADGVKSLAIEPGSVKTEGAKLYRIEQDGQGGLFGTLAVYCTVILPDGRKMKSYESVKLPLTPAVAVGQIVA